MDFKSKIRKFADEKREEKVAEKEINPDSSELHREVYDIVESGAKIGGEFRMGATDPEIEYMLRDRGVKSSTLRYVRWAMVKTGYLKDKGSRRSIMSGFPKSNVWVVTDKYLDVEETGKVILIDKGKKYAIS